MSYYPIHRYFIYDRELMPVKAFRISENRGGVYEVLRVNNGVALFLEEHLARFFLSASLSGKKINFEKREITTLVYKLINSNEVAEGNILLSCKEKLKIFFIPHKYPAKEWYTTGVACGVLTAERENPNAKVFQTSVRENADRLINEKGFYEVLLVDREGFIAEGSRSNVFFVSDKGIVTPPAKKVLLGITRQKVIRLAKVEDISVFEENVKLSQLQELNAAFITGTSPKVLPIVSVDKYKFNPADSVVQRLRKAYDNLIREYVNKY